jgi:hypothetical protein
MYVVWRGTECGYLVGRRGGGVWGSGYWGRVNGWGGVGMCVY